MLTVSAARRRRAPQMREEIALNKAAESARRERAATRVQAAARGMWGRRAAQAKASEFALRTRAATRLQAGVRGARARREASQLRWWAAAEAAARKLEEAMEARQQRAAIRIQVRLGAGPWCVCVCVCLCA